MKVRFYDMIDLFLTSEKERVIKEIERHTRVTLEGFAETMDRVKGVGWKIGEVTEADGRAYYESLGLKSRDIEREKRLWTLLRFMTFAKSEGWINELPWRGLFQQKKGGEGHFRVSEKDRAKLIKSLEKREPSDLWGHRDRAMLLLLLTYRLRKTEVSKLDAIDYDGERITVRTSMEWRNREIKAEGKVKEAIDAYLRKRRELDEAPEERALFIGFKRGRISPGMVNLILKEFVRRGDIK